MDSDSEEIKLTINKEYAERYQHSKKAQELSHIRDKYGPDVDEEDLEKIAERQHKYGYSKKAELDYDSEDSEEEEEDETGELITPELDGQIMRTIGLIRAKDPKIYEAANYFFIPEEMENARKEWKEKQEQAKKNKPVTLKDYHRKVLLEDGGIVDDEKELDKAIKEKKKDESEMTYVEQQEHLKKEMRGAFGDDGDNDDEEDTDSFFTQKAKTKEDEEAEEEDYKRFLMESMGSNKAGASAFQDWQNYKNTKVDKDEAFLMDYILNRGWIDKSQKKTPHYKEIVREEDLDNLEKSEDELDAAEEWESKYNFRFEEANGDSLMGYSRTIDDSVRNKDDRRKKQRQRKKERKAEETLRKQEELKRLKNQKKQEIFEKLKKIQEITGNDTVGFSEIDLETEFNPEDYDEKMQSMFSDKYYDADENEKPVFDDDIDTGMYEEEEEEGAGGKDESNEYDAYAEGDTNEYAEDEDVYAGDEGEEGYYDEQYEGYDEEGYGDDGYEGYGGEEEEDILMDADYLPGGEKYGETAEKKKKLSKKEREMIEKEAKKMAKKQGTGYKTAVEAIAASRSALDVDKEKRAFNDYLEEYYQLDYEDMVGDTPTRFKYSKVKPTAYGLSPVEILLADDKDLNEFVSLKKFAPYRRPEDEERDIQRISKKKRLQLFRHKLKSQLSKEPVDKLWDPARWKRREMEKKKQQEDDDKDDVKDKDGKNEESKKLKNKKKQDKKKEKKKLSKSATDTSDDKHESNSSKKRKSEETSDEEPERKKEKKEKKEKKKDKKEKK